MSHWLLTELPSNATKWSVDKKGCDDMIDDMAIGRNGNLVENARIWQSLIKPLTFAGVGCLLQLLPEPFHGEHMQTPNCIS